MCVIIKKFVLEWHGINFCWHVDQIHNNDFYCTNNNNLCRSIFFLLQQRPCCKCTNPMKHILSFKLLVISIRIKIPSISVGICWFCLTFHKNIYVYFDDTDRYCEVIMVNCSNVTLSTREAKNGLRKSFKLTFILL